MAFFLISSIVLDLLTIVSDGIARAFNRSGATRAVALDISKAFNRVYNAHKLRSYRISGKIFGFISSFLSNSWLQVVRVEFLKGSFLVLHTFFLLYINDLADVICNIRDMKPFFKFDIEKFTLV